MKLGHILAAAGLVLTLGGAAMATSGAGAPPQNATASVALTIEAYCTISTISPITLTASNATSPTASVGGDFTVSANFAYTLSAPATIDLVNTVDPSKKVVGSVRLDATSGSAGAAQAHNVSILTPGIDFTTISGVYDGTVTVTIGI